MTTSSEETRRDTGYVLNYSYGRETILHGVYGEDSPIFDALAADRFASDRTTKAEKHFHIWSDMPCFCVDEDDEFNLGRLPMNDNEKWPRTSPGFDTTREACEHQSVAVERIIEHNTTDRNEVANHEKLIAEARAEAEATKNSTYTNAPMLFLLADALEAAEKALGEATVTPTAHEVTTDEREALVSVIADARSGDDFDLGEFIGDRPLADRIFSAGFRLTETPEPSDEHQKHADARRSETMNLISHSEPSAPMSLADDPMRKPFLKKRAEPQGEPSDAQVGAAIREASRRSLMWRTSSDVRAVLRAAMSLREGEVR